MAEWLLSILGYCTRCKSWIKLEMITPNCSGGICKCNNKEYK